MSRINKLGYVERRVSRGKKGAYRDWWFIRYGGNLPNQNTGQIHANTISVPERYMGKRIKIKIEVIDDEKVQHKQSKRC